jgi:hypothetical protein
MGLSVFLSKATRANDIKDLIVLFDGFLKKTETDFGVTKSFRVSINKTRKEANRKALAVLSEIDDPLLVTDEQKAILRQYTGEGNIGGSTDEYYTPKWLAKGMWDMLDMYGGANGNVLEPSAGTGVFNGSKPDGVIMTATELSATSSRINQILHPEDEIKNSNFEKFAADESTNGTFDSVVGNVPFGSARGDLATDDKAYLHRERKETYFVDRAIDKAKPGGYITLVVPQNIVGGKSLNKFRYQISLKAEFLGAHKIAAGAFAAQGSESVVTDVLIMRKHSEEMADLMVNAKTTTLRETNVLWSQFITGKWFDQDGKRFINGEIIKGAANYEGDLVSIPNLPKGLDGKQLTAEQDQTKSEMIDVHNQATAKSLSTKFESRIDWDALELAEPEAISYIEGDQRQINGRWHEFVDGEWLPVKISNTSGMLDTDKFGASTITSISNLVSSPAAALNIDFKHLKNIHSNFKDKTQGIIANAFNLAAKHPVGHQERIVKGVLIGSMVEDYSQLRTSDPSGAAVKLQEIQSQLNATYDKLGTSQKVKGLKNVKGSQTASYYQSFVNSMDQEGKFSDLINGQLDTSDTTAFDRSNEQHVVDLITRNTSAKTMDLQAFKDTFTGELPAHVNIDDDNSLLDHLSEFENIAVDGDGRLSQFDRATSGTIDVRNAELMRALANDNLTAKQKLNITRQIESIKSKRTLSTKEDIYFDLRGKWLPRQLVVEFFHDMGYDELDYAKIDVDADGEVTETPGYDGMDGLFTGYFSKDGKLLPNNDDTRFFRQVEKYLNGETVNSGNGIKSSETREKIRAMEKQFQNWAKQHPDVDSVVDKYNDAFNNKIAFEHSDAPLELENVSGNIINMGYQNSGIRRLSEEGRGILAFGTGLGKTFTALGLVAHNQKEGRSKRTCIVVPKSVNENWINETIEFYGHGNIDKTVFVGFEFERDENNKIKTEDVLDDDGNAKTYPATGNTKTTTKVSESSAEQIRAKMHKIPHSNTNLVLMTKEQFARIPMKATSIKDNAQDHMGNLSATGKVDIFADTYKAQQKKEAAMAKLVDEGSDKEYDYPFFEDMHFDTVIVDEGHNYRNSQDAGNLSRQLVYLSAGSEAKVAADMRQKMQYLGRTQNGRGAVMLTATPTPNSPLDIYNMLSHILTPEEWLKMGIADQDDFINVFGETSEVQINRIDGTVAMAQGLTGFKNLTALRGLFDNNSNRKNIKDVASETTVPEIINSNTVVDMSDEQKDIYEMLRLRAEVLRASSSEAGIDGLISSGDKSPAEIALIEEIADTYPDDQIFSVMRDMERVSSDMDLFNKRMTFIFAKDKAVQAQAVVDAIKTPITVKIKQRNEQGIMENVTEKVDLDPAITPDDTGKLIVSVNDAFESALIAGLKKQKLTQADVTHPIPPKYARLLDNLKTSHEAGGKQIIFTEEKSQHKKLHRMISHHLGLEENQVGILNGSTVSGDESTVNESNYKKLGAKAAKAKREELEAQGLDSSDTAQDGLESIAKRFNTGQFRILICNKKAEVGINLHIKTTDVHHMTLPWTPASVDQRNGRAARVGAPQTHVNSHFYLAKGSFDQFRLDTINRKRAWQADLIDGDANRADNGDADDDNDTGLLLSNNPEEYAAMQEMQKRELAEKVRQSKVDTAGYTLGQYLKADALSKQDTEKLEEQEAQQVGLIASSQRQIDFAQGQYDSDPVYYGYALSSVKKFNKEKKALQAGLKRIQNRIKAVEKAKKQVKQFKPQVIDAIESGVLDVDKGLIENPADYLFTGKREIKLKSTYLMLHPDGQVVVRVNGFNRLDNTVHVKAVSGPVKANDQDPDSLLEEVILSESEAEMLSNLKNNYYHMSDAYKDMDRDSFFDFLKRKLLPSALDVLTLDGGEYELFKLKDVIDKNLIIYPDKTSAALKDAIAKLYIKNQKEGNWSTQRDSATLCSVLFGSSYADEVAKYDENAETDEDIADFINSKANEFAAHYDEALKEAMSGEATNIAISLLRRATRTMGNDIPRNSVRDGAFRQAIADRMNELIEQLKSEHANKMQQVSDKINQRFQFATTSSTDDIRKRLGTLPAEIYKAYLYGSALPKTFANDELPGSAYENDVAVLIMDLISAGMKDHRYSADDKFSEDSLMKIFGTMQTDLRNDTAILKSFINGDEPEVPVDVIEDVPSEADTSDISYAAILKDKFDITCLRNTDALEFKSYKGKVYASADPYEYVGFFDPSGKGGPLHDALSPLKRRKKAINGGDASSDFPGFWWFVKADMPADELLAAFDL